MPRTKVAKKSSKRNRDQEEANSVREFKKSLEKYIYEMENDCTEYITYLEQQLVNLINRTTSILLKTKMGDFMKMDPGAIVLSESIVSNNKESTGISANSYNSITFGRGKPSNPNDEGYLTEDSGSIGACNKPLPTPLANFTRGRTPRQGPLASARARRSRSACENDFMTSLKSLPNSVKHNKLNPSRSSRNKLRTPVLAPRHAFSADRTTVDHTLAEPHSPPTAFLRWPKPGELVLSTDGSPIVAQFMPGKFANVNIPMRNGVFSLQPKKLEQLNPDIIESIDPDTLHQIRTLNASLDLIVSLADKAIALK